MTQTEREKNPAGTIIFVLLIIIAVLYFITQSGGSSSDRSSAPSNTRAPARTTTYNIVYKVTGEVNGRASLTYENESGGTEQRTVKLPWEYKFKAERGDFLYISAQNEKDRGPIRCLITQNGASVQNASSSGAYVIAKCSGRVE